ncbi:MAG: recombinase family protein [Ruminococcus flavefaciens]|nr:recombinase family protein [Ruminococcus flavefaciens]
MQRKPIAAIYARLSEEDRDKTDSSADSESIINQVMLLQQYADNNGWDVYECYTDDDWTGADRNRPAFNRLLKDAEQGKFDIVLCKTQSRFTRELELVEKYIHGLFPIWGIRFVGVVDNADTSIKGNKKSRQINGLVNEWYLEDMSENIRAVLTTRRQEGYYIGSTPLYGYRKDPDRKGHLVVDPEAAEVVKLVFHSFANGMGKTAIARMLNERGIPNPTEYKRQKGITYKTPHHKIGTLWKYFAIADMLTNEMYIGNLVQGKYGSVSYKTKQNKPVPKEQWIRVEHTHEPIIDKELWDTVQKMLKERAKPFSTGEIGLFARKVRCKHCGYIMRSGKSRGKHYLECNTRHVAKDVCIGSFVYVDKLEQIVLEELRKMNEEYLDEERLEHEIVLKHSLSDEIAKWKSRSSQMEQKIAQFDTAMKNLYMDKVKGDIDAEQFKVLCRELEADREKVKDRYKLSVQKVGELQQQMEKQRDKKKVIREYVNVKKLNRAMVEQLIDYIEVSKRDPETKILNVEIHWNF